MTDLVESASLSPLVRSAFAGRHSWSELGLSGYEDYTYDSNFCMIAALLFWLSTSSGGR